MDIYVGNINYNVTEDELSLIFQVFGPVESVIIVRDKRTGNSRGFGFVKMINSKDAYRAVKELNRHLLSGRRIVVYISKSNEDMSSVTVDMNSEEITTKPIENGLVKVRFNKD